MGYCGSLSHSIVFCKYPSESVEIVEENVVFRLLYVWKEMSAVPMPIHPAAMPHGRLTVCRHGWAIGGQRSRRLRNTGVNDSRPGQGFGRGKAGWTEKVNRPLADGPMRLNSGDCRNVMLHKEL